MSKRLLIAVGLLALAQAVTLVWLGSRLDAGAAMEVSGAYPIAGLAGRAAFSRGAFHLLGTLLAVAWLVALPSLGPLGKLPRLLFVPWGISALSWFAWLVQGLPPRDLLSLRVGAPLGLMAGTIIPVIATISFRNESARVAGLRPAARRGMVFAAMVLIWCWAFAIVQVEIVSGAMDLVR